ncbi:MAG: TIGR00300 family protein [candidate division Zixibacteria bacterium]|nr:TIGR00300 family protein [candidate division Zixibacteria bacterium]
MTLIEKIIRTEGHLIDSGLLRRVFDTVISDGGRFEVLDFTIGRNNDEFSRARIKINADDVVDMNTILLKLSTLGCVIDKEEEITLVPAPADGVVPPDFYSTTNHETFIQLHGTTIKVDKLRMDGVIVVGRDDVGLVTASVRKLRDVRKGDSIVVGLSGVKVKPEYVERSRSDFRFMSAEVSTERKVRLAVDRVAELINDRNKKVVTVAGPVVVHTGGAPDLARLIENGYIQALLAGNAVAVHDIEADLYGTSLGLDLQTGRPVEMGHRNHLRAINEVRRAGSIAALVDEGLLTSGIMFSAIRTGIPFSLAGSLRDDGPLPETVTDMNQAQDDHSRILEGADIVLMLSSMLHSIAVGNMLPANVLTICVDINPSAVAKLKDRGSLQTIGIVTDVGLFLQLLASKLLDHPSVPI